MANVGTVLLSLRDSPPVIYKGGQMTRHIGRRCAYMRALIQVR